MRALGSDILVLATHNKGKLAEMRELLGSHPFTVKSAAEFDLPEPEETGTTFIENARIKAHAAATATGLPALADDSGLEVDALDGAPGVYTADWAETPQGRDFPMAMEKVHKALADKSAPEPQPGRFRATLVLAWPDGHDEVFEGAAEGNLVWPPAGSEGHGYDPVFRPTGHDITFGQMDKSLKNQLSHRGLALAKLVAALGG